MRNSEGTAQRRELIWPALCSFGLHALLFLLVNSGMIHPGVVWVAADMLPQAQVEAGSSQGAEDDEAEAGDADADADADDVDVNRDDADATIVTQEMAPHPAVPKAAAKAPRTGPFISSTRRMTSSPKESSEHRVATEKHPKATPAAAAPRPLENRTTAFLPRRPAFSEKPAAATTAGDRRHAPHASPANGSVASVAPTVVPPPAAPLPTERVDQHLHKAVQAAVSAAPAVRPVAAPSPGAAQKQPTLLPAVASRPPKPAIARVSAEPAIASVSAQPAIASVPMKPAKAAGPVPAPPGKEASRIARELSAASASGSPRTTTSASRESTVAPAREQVAPKVTPEAPVPKAAAKPEQPKGVYQEAPSGDIDLEISGGGAASVNGRLLRVLFTPYPENRHNRPMTVAESRKVKTLAPAVVRTKEDTVKAVIEVAPAGVYEFQWGAHADGVGEARCILSLPGSRRKHKGKSLGTCRPEEGRIIARILMPEGILWDEEGSFNGSIEDGESVTKYNSDTGLTWKEYKR